MLADREIGDRIIRKVEDAPWRADGPDARPSERRDRPKGIRGIPVNVGRGEDDEEGTGSCGCGGIRMRVWIRGDRFCAD